MGKRNCSLLNPFATALEVTECILPTATELDDVDIFLTES
jgi:hypothetical protein